LANQAGVDIDNKMKVQGACIKTLLRRIRPLPVNIIFADKIINKQALSMQNVVPVYDMALRIIRNIARINNPPPLHPFEQPAAFIGLDFEDLFGDVPKDPLSAILATKVDYFCFLEVFCGLFNAVDDFITPRQLIIFNTIRKFNLEKLKDHRKKGQDDQSLINYMHENDVASAWITRAALHANLKADIDEDISVSTLDRELQELMERELIRRIKKPGRKYEYGYGVFQLVSSAPLFEMNLSLIRDPIFKEEAVEVKRLIQQ
jgi:hypothetical protein